MKKILCLIAAEDRLWNMRRALLRTEETCPGLFSGSCWSLWDLCAHPEKTPAMLAEAEACDFAIMRFHGSAQKLEGFPKVWQAITRRMPVYFESSLPQEIAELMPDSGLTEEEYRELQKYFRYGDEPNYYGMLLCIARDRFGAQVSPPAPVPPLEEGLYDRGRVLSREEAEERIALAARGEKPVVGLILHQSQIVNDNVRHIDATLAELDRLGAVTLPLFTRMSSDEDEKLGIRGAMERYFTREGRSLPDVILVLTGLALTHMGWPGDGVREVPDSIFSFYDVPAIQVMLTRFTPEDYETLPQGIDSLSLTSHVFQPETDGQIISVPNAAQAAETGPAGERKLFVPLPDRVERVCRLAMNWAKLRRTAAGEKRIAILFNTMPGNDRIGCAEGLDTFESVLRIVEALRDEGVETDFSFETAQALADAVTAGLTNDLRWTSEEAMEEKAAAVIPPETWRSWFGPLSERVREALSGAWGRAPGEVMALDDRLLIPGLLCGHIFIGLQPSRAFGERASELYHSTDSTPPYSYLAYYRWLEECFGADCVVHVGTHGTLEWTPGKEVGLSRDCWPDLCLGSLPHLYPYHMGIVGEGIQAKRRSWAVILDHMPPSLDEAESYEGLAVIDEALKEYHQARQVRPAQAPALARRIFDLAAGERLTLDLGLDEKGFEADPDGAVEAIHLWMGELKNSLVKDGLHVFGQVPEGKLYENLLRALVRVKNGGVPALTDSVIAALGHDPEAVKDAPAADFGGVSGLELRDMATAAARRLVSALAERGWDPAAIGAVLEREAFPGGTADLRRVLEFLCTVVTDKLDHVTDEMRYFLAGFAGRFVPPALGGNPTRGNVSILPTGRNFYASDPTQIPSRAAWEIGGRLARQLLDQYAGTGEGVPESVAMVVWAGNTIKTCGEDFAECLHLMGVRPVYLGESSCVAGVEPIPLSELGRPRIDVTLRISGLFRDMYPNLIRLMDQAVTSVGTLDEPEEQNFIKKHLRQDVEALTSRGIPRDQALDEAYLRVYGCAPGTYGSAVAKVIESRQWTDFRDLARVFETWSGYGYSGREHGTEHTEAFRRRLSTVAVTVKNESTAEYDMLDSDDFYAYHGGLAAAVRANSGHAPLSVTGHTDDPDRPVTRTLARETARVVHSRILNPKWLEGLKRHGFKGAQEISAALDSLFGWDATADAAEDWMYQSFAERFLFDWDTRRWMERVNRWAVHSAAERLLEAHQRGMWETDGETLRKLRSIYMQAEGSIEEAST
ncbi:MAG: cobaltochelatase subunit CobN [Oscillospiraceae bacterium]|nr:cobaltochelatase subunit CobN [Oscillospiraceae bacterium]